MSFVEWLRVRGALKWTAIVLGVCLLVAIVVRVAVIGRHNVYSWSSNLRADPGTKVTESVLPDGTKRVTIDDPLKKMYLLIDDRGRRGRHVEITDRGGNTETLHDYVVMGNSHVSKLPNHGGTLTVIDTNGETQFYNYAGMGCFVAVIIATILGAPFARENDGHLEATLTKPISRERLALAIVGTDAIGILAAFGMGVVFGIVAHASFEIPNITFGPKDAAMLAIGLLAPLAWYAMLTAATASVKRGWGAVLGFAWPVALLVVGLAFVPPNGNPLATLVHDVASVLSLIDPVAYMHFGGSQVRVEGDARNIMAFSDQFRATMLAVLTLAYAALAILQWRRVEA